MTSIEISGCGPPSTPLNGYINPYTSTAEGAEVTFKCQNTSQNWIETPQIELHSAVCTNFGKWEPDLFEFCSGTFLATAKFTSIGSY